MVKEFDIEKYNKLRDAIQTGDLRDWNDAFSMVKFFYKLDEQIKDIVRSNSQ